MLKLSLLAHARRRSASACSAFLALVPNFLPQPALRQPARAGCRSARITLGPRPAGRLLPAARGRGRRRSFSERLESLVDDVRAGLRAARIGYRGLGVQGDDGHPHADRPGAARARRSAEIDKLNPRLTSVGFGASTARDFEVDADAAAGSRCARPTPSGTELRPVRGQPVARGRAPPDRRARHARGLDPAPGRRPDPGPGPGRAEPGEHQAPARPHRPADLPHGRPAGQRRRGPGQGRVPPGSMLLESAERERRAQPLSASSARSSSAARA